MIKYYAKKFSNINEKIFKITFSGLDKYLTNTDVENSLTRINEIKIVRLNKSGNKNYCHLELSSLLSINDLKSKLENFKILGKSVKIRIKELDEDTHSLIKNTHNLFDTNNINIDSLISSASNFYIKNLAKNYVNVKDFINQLDENKNLLITKTIDRELYNFEYKIDTSKEELPFLNIKTNNDFTDDPNNITKSKYINNIWQKLTFIFDNLKFSSYDSKRRKGTLRDLQIRFNDLNYMINLMISHEEITNVDVKCLEEAIKYEFKELKDVIFYLSINENILGKLEDSPYFNNLIGVHEYINISDLYIYPFDHDLQLFLKNIDINSVYDRDGFSCIIDKTNDYMPYSTLINTNCREYVFKQEKFKFEIFRNSKIIEPLRCKKIYINEKNNIDYENSLLALNIRKYNQKTDYTNLVKYQLLISNSFNQLLDYLKNYPSRGVKLKKLYFLKTGKYEYDDIVLAIELK